MPLILGTNSIKDTGYDVANSCRFNDGDSPYMYKDLGTATAGSGSKFTFSVWVKRGVLGTDQYLFSGGVPASNHLVDLCFKDDDTMRFRLIYNDTTYGHLRTDAKFRDVSAWYHIVINMDTTQGTAANRTKMYVNGSQVTSFSTSTRPNEDSTFTVNNNTVNSQRKSIGRNEDSSGDHFDGYMAEAVWIDGTAYAASSFGEFNEDSPNIWQPVDVSGLTFGTHGFYLDFEASDNLGNDANGGTDLTESGLAAIDQCVDSPTNNYNTMNPLVFRTTSGTKYSPTFSEGNTYLVSTNDATYDISGGTFMLSSGKWYFEWKANGVGDTAADFSNCAGIKPADGSWAGTSAYAGTNRVYGASGKKCDSASTVATYGSTWTTNDIIGCYVDLDNYKIYFAKNGTMQNSADVSAGTGFAFDDLDDHDSWIVYTSLADFGVGAQSGSYFNFGNPAFTISSSNSDANGYGSFEYNPTEDGVNFYAINTKNLAEFG